MNNSINFLKILMGNASPQQTVMNMMINNSNPILKNLVDMAKNGDKTQLEEFAKNYCNEKGIDFNKEFNDFMKNFK